MSAVDELVNCVDACRTITVATRERRLTIARRVAVAVWAAIVVYRTVDNGFRVQPRVVAALHLHRTAGGQHRSGPPHALCHPGLAAVRVGARRLRPQQGSGEDDRAADDVALAGRRADRWMFFGTIPTVWLQERLKLPSRRGGRSSSAPFTCRSSSFRTSSPRCCGCAIADEWKAFARAVRRAVLRGADHLCAAARRAAMGRRSLHRRRCRTAVRRTRGACSALPAGSPTADCSARYADHPGRRQRLGRADRRSGLGQAEPPFGECADRPGPGERQPGGGDPLAARRPDRCGRGVPVDARFSGSGGPCWWRTSS